MGCLDPLAPGDRSELVTEDDSIELNRHRNRDGSHLPIALKFIKSKLESHKQPKPSEMLIAHGGHESEEAIIDAVQR